MNNRINWIIISLTIIFILSFTYIAGGKFVENYFNLLLRDWILALVIILCMICILIVETIIFTKLSKILEKKVAIHNIFKSIIQTISMVLISAANLYVLFICIFIIAMSYQEVGVETYEGEKYLVTDTGWATPAHTYNYHLYKNFFVYDADTKYSGEIKWEDYSEIEIDDEKQPNTIPNIPEEDMDNIPEEEEEVIEVIPRNIAYIQKIDDNLNYGFYLIDRAMHQYLYSFVQSKDEGLSWEVVHIFPSTSEMYYANFLDKELGFINFGSSEGLSLFMTNDGGLTWKDVLINLPEGKRSMLYVQDIKKSGETIELILGLPSWSNSDKSIKYISVDRGLSWNLQI